MSSRILIVSADEQTASVVVHACRVEGYDVQVRTTFETALQFVASTPPDLVISWVRLGPFNGLHLAMRCHALHPELPFIVIGVGSDARLETEAAAYDVRFLTSPTQTDLLATVRELLARKHRPVDRALNPADADLSEGASAPNGFSIT